jgi:hypothetical protein
MPPVLETVCPPLSVTVWPPLSRDAKTVWPPLLLPPVAEPVCSPPPLPPAKRLATAGPVRTARAVRATSHAVSGTQVPTRPAIRMSLASKSSTGTGDAG